eukprot:20935-Heterococcus_DN1.PRE.2
MAFLDERELFTETLLSEMLAVAASSSKWLRQRGAEWPDMLWHGRVQLFRVQLFSSYYPSGICLSLERMPFIAVVYPLFGKGLGSYSLVLWSCCAKSSHEQGVLIHTLPHLYIRRCHTQQQIYKRAHCTAATR